MNMRAEQQEKQKPKRVPMGRRQVLKLKGLKDDDQFHYHWFNDVGDRLNHALDGGYEFVPKSGLQAGDQTVEYARGTDSIMKKGVGMGTIAYLMKIPMEIYMQDQAEKLAQVDKIEAEIKRPKGEGTYGKVEVSR